MSKGAAFHHPQLQPQNIKQRVRANCTQTKSRSRRPAVAHRQRGKEGSRSLPFNAPEIWHPPTGQTSEIRYIVDSPGTGYVHAVTVEEVQQRIAQLPNRFLQGLEVVHLSRMTKKKACFPCYGMQWGSAIYLYPIETSYQEVFSGPPTPQQQIDAKMYGGEWRNEGQTWILHWTQDSIRDFYLNSVLIHEIGHIHDHRNTQFQDRERYANWFAIEYGYRFSRNRC